jgi:HK97 family phage portal protein
MIVSNGQALDFAPQALGETVPNLANGYFYARTGLGLANLYATYAALYRAQPSISTVVDKVAAAAARLTVKVWDVTPASGRVEDTSSAYAQLIARPCSKLDPFAFYRWTFSTYEIYGEAFWYKQRRDQNSNGTQSGPVVNLLPMHPSRTAIHRDTDGNVEYVFTLGVASAGILRAPETDVVAFRRYNPDMLMRGLSRLEPLRSTLLNEDASRRATQSFWTKGNRPGLLLKHPSTLSQNAQDRLRAQTDAIHAGADNAGGTMILEEGLDAVIVQLTMEEMQYIEARKLNLQEACMVYDVPPPVIHILDHATYSNITEQMRSMYRDTMAPRLEDVESVIDWALTGEFFPAGQREVEFDMGEVLRGDFETRVDKAVVMRNAGIATGNESRDLVGLPISDDPEMDKLYANAALVPLGTPAEKVSITEAATPDPVQAAEAQAAAEGAAAAAADAQAQPGKALSRSLVYRSAMGVVGRTKDASKVAIRKAMVDEHHRALSKFFGQQHEAVRAAVTSKASGAFDPSAWDGDLASVLHGLSAATAQAIGQKVAKDLGGEYSSDDIASWLTSNSKATAQKVNQATADEIAKALESASETDDLGDVVDGVFAGEVTARADQISNSRVATIAGLASLVAARMSSAKTKTWVTGGNPRGAHAQMSGQTVPLGEKFSNGMDGPGDYSGGADEVANCNCDMDFSTEG